MIEILSSKIHRAVVTDANVEYEGSITISKSLTDIAGMREFQKVMVVDVNNGSRFETYIISSEEKGVICVNGAAARLVSVGDRIIIMTFDYLNEVPVGYKPNVVLLNEKNEVK